MATENKTYTVELTAAEIELLMRAALGYRKDEKEEVIEAAKAAAFNIVHQSGI